jgi:hypothetical protein
VLPNHYEKRISCTSYSSLTGYNIMRLGPDLTYVSAETREELKKYNNLKNELQEQCSKTNILLPTTLTFLATTIYLSWKCRKKERRKTM